MIDLKQDGPVLTASFRRPPLNTIDDGLCAALDHVIDEAARVQAAVIHLRAATTHFCGGADPVRVAAWADPVSGAAAAAADTRRWDALFRRLEDASAIVLAEISGHALGAGLGLALACDLRIAAADATIGVPEARFGLLPLGGTIGRLRRIAGRQATLRLLLGAEIVDGAEARHLGLVDWVVAPEALAETAMLLAKRGASLPVAAVAEVRRLIDDEGDAPIAEAGSLERLLADADVQARCRKLLERLSGKGGRP
jgi:enoyl-CoA hydratase